jgi:hypothetical protein
MADVALVDDNVLLTGNSVLLKANSVSAKCDMLRYEGSPFVLSTRDLFITWSVNRANLHIGSLLSSSPDAVGNETDAGQHESGHEVRIEGVVYADDFRLVRWEMSDPKELADLLEQIEKVRQGAGRGDEFIDMDELEAQFVASDQSGSVRLEDHLGDVDASKRDKLPDIIEALRTQRPKLVRRDTSLLARLASIEARLDALEGKP